MLFSTLPDVPGKSYTVLGIVYTEELVRNTLNPFDLQKAFKNLIDQANTLKANAVIHVQILRANDVKVIISGTAVRIH